MPGRAVLRDGAAAGIYLRQVARWRGWVATIGLLPDLATNLDDTGSLVMAVAEKIRSALESPVTIDGRNSSPVPASAWFSQILTWTTSCARPTPPYRPGARPQRRRTEPAMQERCPRYALDRELREAVRDRSFELHLQSQVNAGGRVIGAEALVRWRHPQRGMVMPTTFIPLAEESGLIVPLGEWVLREACMLIARLDAEGRGIRIAVNVSPRQFHQINFVQRVKEILSATGADPGYLTLEITENLLVEHASESVARMTELSALGLRFSIDDFGTGYSVIGVPETPALSELKIDKSLCRTFRTINDVALVETILSMARHAIQVVAEGVENGAQLAFLHQQGCERFQDSSPAPE
jgi:EAL domain-containing protein (putative c-di-GMP-specific phosphodiesterase class I)